MPTRTIVLLAAMVGIIVLIIISIIITVIVTGNVLARKHEDERPNSRYLVYVKSITNHRCPNCDSELKLFTGEDRKTYYKCKNESCDYIVDPEELLEQK